MKQSQWRGGGTGGFSEEEGGRGRFLSEGGKTRKSQKRLGPGSERVYERGSHKGSWEGERLQ